MIQSTGYMDETKFANHDVLPITYAIELGASKQPLLLDNKTANNLPVDQLQASFIALRILMLVKSYIRCLLIIT